MRARHGILAGGNWIIDKLKVVDTWPRQDALANILAESIGNGGSPFNLLMDLARLGAPFPLMGVGLIGNDAEGQWISKQCAAHKINTEQLRVHPTAPTSYTDVMTVRSTGRRTFFHQRGANAFLGDEHFNFASTRPKIFHLGYLLLLDRMDLPDPEFGTVAARTLQRARQAGCQTSIDVVSEDSRRFSEVVLPALPFVDFCFLNEFELERITGITVRKKRGVDLAAVKTAAKKLIRAGVQKWVVVHFPEAACALSRHAQFHIQRSLDIPPVKIVSTVGAGDAFAAGVMYGVHQDSTIKTALHYGACAAAGSLCGPGASDGIGRLEECIALKKIFGTRS